jgi:WD40 repeat protein
MGTGANIEYSLGRRRDMNKVFFCITVTGLLILAACQSNPNVNLALNNSETVSEVAQSSPLDPTNAPIPQPSETPVSSNTPVPTPTRDPLKLSFGVNPHEIANLKGGGAVISMAWHPDNILYAIGGVENILILEMQTLSHAYVLEGHTEPIVDMAWSPNGSALASLSLDGTVRIWKNPDYTDVLSLETGQALGLDWSPDGQSLAVGTEQGQIQIWNPLEETAISTWDQAEADEIIRLDWSPNGKLIATAHSSGVVDVWDTVTGEIVDTLVDSEESPVTDLAWAPNNSSLATAHQNGLVHFWDTDSMTLANSIQALKNGITKIAWSSDSLILAAGGVDNKVACWDISSGTELQGAGMRSPVWSLAWSPNNNFLTIGSAGLASGPGTIGPGGQEFSSPDPKLNKSDFGPNPQAGIVFLWIRQQ